MVVRVNVEFINKEHCIKRMTREEWTKRKVGQMKVQRTD